MARPAMQKNQIVRLIVGAGQASPSPPVGPALGSRGVKSIDFCKEFNARTAHVTLGTPTPARIIVRPDRTFAFDLRTPPTSWLLHKAANAPLGKKGKMKGASNPGKEWVGEISLKHLFEIAKVKQTETRLSGLSLEALARCVLHQARTAGIKVVP